MLLDQALPLWGWKTQGRWQCQKCHTNTLLSTPIVFHSLAKGNPSCLSSVWLGLGPGHSPQRTLWHWNLVAVWGALFARLLFLHCLSITASSSWPMLTTYPGYMSSLHFSVTLPLHHISLYCNLRPPFCSLLPPQAQRLQLLFPTVSPEPNSKPGPGSKQALHRCIML